MSLGGAVQACPRGGSAARFAPTLLPTKAWAGARTYVRTPLPPYPDHNEISQASERPLTGLLTFGQGRPRMTDINAPTQGLVGDSHCREDVRPRPRVLDMAIRVDRRLLRVSLEGAGIPKVLRLPGDPRCSSWTCQYGMLQNESRFPWTKGGYSGSGALRRQERVRGMERWMDGDTCVRCAMAQGMRFIFAARSGSTVARCRRTCPSPFPRQSSWAQCGAD